MLVQYLPIDFTRSNSLSVGEMILRNGQSPLKSRRKQWRIQKLFAGGTDEVFNHIFKGCGRVFLHKIYTKFFFSRGAAAHPDHYVGPPLVGKDTFT
ncbi:hypothetical protein Hanom_Chr13g01237761 [Helianthus anomalus]